MGMFDYLKIESSIKIPVSKEFKSLKIDPHTLEFQTKDLDNCLDVYTIKNNKKLYKENKLTHHHGIINFGSLHPTDTIDYFLDYQAKFTDGILKNIKLVKYYTTKHESRELTIKKLNEKSKKNKSKLSYKLLKGIQEIFIKKPLSLLGLKLKNDNIGILTNKKDFFISFHKPKITFLYKSENLSSKSYGISISEITTELLFTNTNYSKELSFRILGFGIKILKYKDFDFIGTYS